MKLASSSTPVEVSGGNASSSFSIAMNGKAFRVLSDTMYQNKIGSIVREVSCNAYDAHIMNGTPDVPFIIHLPDAFEPWFSVQDFGVGLSPEDMNSVFTVYFQSTKDSSNDAVGAFGLGAKTPFSYTDQFTVTSVKDGMRYIYSAYITESGVPAIVQMAATPTTDVNGVEIKLSVKREDYRNFATEVAQQLRFFKVKPKVINGGGNFAFTSVSNNLIVDTANVAVSSDNVSYGQVGIHIIQGNVGYPLDMQQLQGKIDAKNASLISSLHGAHVRFYFDIGQIGVTASREGIEYNAATIASIDAKLTLARNELTAYIVDQIASEPNTWGKAMILNSSAALNRLARGAGITLPNVSVNGAGYYYFDFSNTLLDSNKKKANGYDTQIAVTKVWSHGKTVRTPASAVIQPKLGYTTVIVLRDTGSKPNIRAKHLLSTLPHTTNLLEITMLVEGGFDDKFITALQDAMGGYSDIRRLSEIEPPASQIADKSGKVRASYSRPTFYSYKNDTASNIRQWEREFDALVDNDEDTVYIVVADMAPLNQADERNIAKFAELIKFIDTPLPLIGIREGDLKKIDGMQNYIKLSDYVEQATARITQNKKLYVKWRHGQIGNLIARHVQALVNRDDVVNAFKVHAPDARPTKIVSMCKRLTVRLAEHDGKLAKIASFMGWDARNVHTDSRDKRVRKCYEKMIERYPLLGIYSDWQVRSSIPVDHLAKYVSVM